MEIVEAVIVNWKRPRNVEKIISALRNQTVPCSITVCDCHPSDEFSLSETFINSVDQIFNWKHNLGGYNRYVPLASFSKPFTFFIDDDVLPGSRCIESFLNASLQKPQFGVLGQYGRIIDSDGIYRPKEIELTNSFIETDFIIRAYFVKTRYLHNLIRFKWHIGYFDNPFPEDDLLLCSSLKYYENLSCYLIPYNNDPETLVNKQELTSEYALSSRTNHYEARTQFIKRIMYYGWKPIHLNSSVDSF